MKQLAIYSYYISSVWFGPKVIFSSLYYKDTFAGTGNTLMLSQFMGAYWKDKESFCRPPVRALRGWRRGNQSSCKRGISLGTRLILQQSPSSTSPFCFSVYFFSFFLLLVFFFLFFYSWFPVAFSVFPFLHCSVSCLWSDLSEPSLSRIKNPYSPGYLSQALSSNSSVIGRMVWHPYTQGISQKRDVDVQPQSRAS